MNYEEKSNDELNFEVARHSFDSGWIDRHYGNEGMIPDYCGSWGETGPIIFHSRIAVLPWNISEWQAFSSAGGADGIRFRTIHPEPLRAAMIVFLMMKDAYK